MDFLADEIPEKVAKVARALSSEIVTVGKSDREVGKEGAVWLSKWIQTLKVPTRLRDVLSSLEGVDIVAAQTAETLAGYGYQPTGGENALMELLKRMW
jgi:hypothetical protein